MACKGTVNDYNASGKIASDCPVDVAVPIPPIPPIPPEPTPETGATNFTATEAGYDPD